MQGKRVAQAIPKFWVLKILAIAALFVPLASYVALLMSSHGIHRNVLSLGWAEQALMLALVLLPTLTLRHLRLIPASPAAPHEME